MHSSVDVSWLFVRFLFVKYSHNLYLSLSPCLKIKYYLSVGIFEQRSDIYCIQTFSIEIFVDIKIELMSKILQHEYYVSQIDFSINYYLLFNGIS